MDNEPMLKVEQVADTLRLSPRTIRLKIQRREIPARKFGIGRGQYRISAAWVRRMVSDPEAPQAA